LGLTQERLAERAGLSVHGIQKLERGVTRPYRETTRRLSRALQLAPNDDAHLRSVGEPIQRRPTARARGLRSAGQHNLPQPLTSFIGREREQAEVARLLTTSRLVTLTGTGGVGKTRLALEVAKQAAAAFRDGVWFASLAALSDTRLVSMTVAQAFGVREHPGTQLQHQLREFLRDRHTLLVLDNCEHVLAAAPDLAGLMADCCQLTVLATSRSSLRIAGEHEFRVPPLETPRRWAQPRQRTGGVPEDRLYDAVLLFLARARSAGAAFAAGQLSDEDAATVSAICVQLEGQPLALELAAARTRYLPPSALLRRLEHQLEVLTQGPRDAPPRQQTVRATLDWSYGLLTAGEQRLFGRLSVFAGGFTLNGVEALYTSLGCAPETVLDKLTALADHGLVHAAGVTMGRPRFAMLAAVHEYAREHLGRDEASLVDHAHAELFATVAEEAEPRLHDAQAEVWYERLDTEFENIQAALTWCCSPAGLNAGSAETGLRLAGALWLYWVIRGRHTASRRWLDGILAAAGRFAQHRWSQSFARALAASGMVESRFGDLPRGRRHGQRALAVARRLHLRREAAMAALVLSEEALVRGATDEVRQHALLALESLGSELRDPPDRWFAACAEMELGEAARLSGDGISATAYLERSAEHYQQLGDALAAARPLLTLVQCALADRNARSAAERLAEVCTTVERAPATWATAPWPLATFVAGCAGLAMLRNQAEWAVQMLAASHELRPGTPLEFEATDSAECYVSAARERLGAAAFATAWAHGQSVARTTGAADVERLAAAVRAGLADSAD
jgi:predicted ATPase/DNA-binding XRE family transcriptional regulator